MCRLFSSVDRQGCSLHEKGKDKLHSSYLTMAKIKAQSFSMLLRAEFSKAAVGFLISYRRAREVDFLLMPRHMLQRPRKKRLHAWVLFN